MLCCPYKPSRVKREQAERVRAQVDAKNAALEAARRAKMEALKLRNWLMGQAMVRNALAQSGLSQAEQARVQAEGRTKGVSAALGLLASLQKAAQERLLTSWRAMEQKLQRAEEAAEKKSQKQTASGWDMGKWKQRDYSEAAKWEAPDDTESLQWQSRHISVIPSRVLRSHTKKQKIQIQDPIPKPWWEYVLEYKYTPVITGAISVLATDAAFVLLAVSAHPLAPATLALAGLCWGIGRIASVVSVISTGYQYKQGLYGTTRLDVEISIATYGLSFIPKPDMAVMNHIGFLYSCYTAFWRK